MRKLSIAGLATVLFLQLDTAHACLWDKDTLAQETERFPSTLEIIGGNFKRRSKRFYRLRIGKTEEAIKKKPSAKLYDDLSVAYEKSGDSKKAIEVIQKSLAQFGPRYETHANLGTFLIHDGEYEKGLEHLRKAIKINPNAHFGREKFQIWLVEFLLKGRLVKDGKIKTPIHDLKWYPYSYIDYLAVKMDSPNGFGIDEQKEAIKGILGMMRFSNHESPVLLQILGDLLATGGPRTNGTILAVMAYLRAAEFSPESTVKKKYEAMAKDAMGAHDNISFKEVKENLAKEVKKGNELFIKTNRKRRQ